MVTSGQFTYKGLFYIWEYNPQTEVLWMKRTASPTEILRKNNIHWRDFKRFTLPEYFHAYIDEYTEYGSDKRRVVYDGEWE
jgi:hypothetical protein